MKEQLSEFCLDSGPSEDRIRRVSGAPRFASDTNDRDVRIALRAFVRSEHPPSSDTLFLEEFALYGGAIRADLAALNGHSYGYEIKSDRDTLARLPQQVAALGLLLTLSASPRILAQDCNQILEHGIFNTTTTDSLSTKTETLINWLSQSTFDSFGQAKDSAAKLGFAIEGIPLELGGHSRETDWHNYQATLQTLNFSDQKTLDQFSQTLVSADKGIVDAWTACILRIQAVSHAVIESSYDPKVFAIKLIYQPVGEPLTATIKDFTVSPSTVNCSPTIHTWWPFRSEISSTGIILACTRQLATDAVQVTANTSKGDVSAKLPGLTPRAAGSIEQLFPIDQLVVVTAENVPTDFKPRATAQHSGCSCDGAQVYFPNRPYNVKVNEEFLFRYDASPTWHVQSFDNFYGVINWGPASTTLHDFHAWDYLAIAGTLKVKFSKPGDYNVVVNMHANCLDGFYHCSVTCSASGTTEVHVK